MAEELIYRKEELKPTIHKKIFVTESAHYDEAAFIQKVDALTNDCTKMSSSEYIKTSLLALVNANGPKFDHSEQPVKNFA